MDMRFYWVQDRVDQGEFRIYWSPGSENLADYFSKRHPPSHYINVRPIYLYETNSPTTLQGCVEILAAPSKRTRAVSTNITGEAQPPKQQSNIAKLYNKYNASLPQNIANASERYNIANAVHTQITALATLIQIANR